MRRHPRPRRPRRGARAARARPASCARRARRGRRSTRVARRPGRARPAPPAWTRRAPARQRPCQGLSPCSPAAKASAAPAPRAGSAVRCGLPAALEPARVEGAALEIGVRRDGGQEGQVGGQAEHDDIVERRAQAGDRPRARLAVHTQLRQQAVVARADDIAAVDPRVDAHAGASRPAHGEHVARGWEEAALGILGVDPRLDRVPAQEHVALLQLERPACGDLELPSHDVDARDQLRHGVLDLDARVHLQEVPAAVGREQELRRAGAHVAHGFGEPQRCSAELAAQVAAHSRARAPPRSPSGDVAAPSSRARPGAAPVPCGVAQDLHLDVAGALDVALVEQAAVAEGRLGLARRGLDGGRELGRDRAPRACRGRRRPRAP